MALLWIEGFEGFDGLGSISVDRVLEKWERCTIGNIANTAVELFDPVVVAGRNGGKALNFGNVSAQASGGGFGYLDTPPIAANFATVVVGFAIYCVGSISTYELLQTLPNNLQLILNSNGSLSTYHNLTGHGMNATSATGLIIPDTWHYIEFRANFHASTGSVVVRVDEATVINLTNIDSVPIGVPQAGWNQVRFITNNGSNYRYFDDIYILDGGGTQNTFLGDSKIIELLPSADSSVEYTPSSGTDNYALIQDETEEDYVDGDIDESDVYEFENLAEDVAIHGICLDARIRRTGSTFLEHANIVNGVESFQTTVPSNYMIFSTSSGEYSSGVAWTQSNLNSSTFGVAGKALP